MSDPVPMELVGVRIELPTNTPILLLRESERDAVPPHLDRHQMRRRRSRLRSRGSSRSAP